MAVSGGRFEKKHLSYEAAATAEMYEEAGLSPSSIKYVGSTVINDWRYAGSPDQTVVTSLFKARAMTTGARADDDIAEVCWFPFKGLTEDSLVSGHRPLLRLLRLQGFSHE